MSGNYGSHEIQLLFDNYGIAFTPHVFFNGTDDLAGGGEEVASGEPYLEIVEDMYYEVSPIKLTIDDFDPVSGSISVTGTMMSSDAEVTDATIRFILLEDEVYEYHTHVTRDYMKDDFDLAGLGNSLSFQKTFEINQSWNTENLKAVVYVQYADLEIIQSVSTYETPTYKTRPLISFPLDYYDENYEPGQIFSSELFSLINLGLTDSINIELIADNIPDGWEIWFSDETGNHFDGTEVSIAEEGSIDLQYHLEANSVDQALFHFEVNSSNGEYQYTIPMQYTNLLTNVPLELSEKEQIGNHPNPFSSNTTISFNTNGKAIKNSELSIYNIKGQKIRSFPIRNIDSTVSKIFWDGTDQNGKEVPAGIYFSKINSLQNVGKMLLFR